MIIFTGTGRSGTGWLAQCFHGSHEYRVHEFIREQWSGMVYDWSDPGRRLRAMKWHLAGVDKRTFADSSNLYVHFLDALYGLDRNVRIVVCERRREDFISSAVNRGWHKYSGYHSMPTMDNPICKLWAGMKPEARCGWQYDFRLAKARERLEVVPHENWLWCHLEDITEDLSPVENFLGLRADDEWRHRHYIKGKAIYKGERCFARLPFAS